jgi:hypothetical protein
MSRTSLRSAEDHRLIRLAEICLALPGAVRAIHGDGIVSVCVKSELGEGGDRARGRSDLYYLPPFGGCA